MAMTGLAIAAALALAKDQLVDRPAANRKRKVEAIKEEGSPWTHEKGNAVDDPDTLGTVMQYGTVGANLGQGYVDAQAAKDYNQANLNYRNAQTARLNTGGSLGGGGAYGGGYGKDFTSGALGGEKYSAALKAKTFSPYTSPSNGYEDLEASGLSPNAPYQKRSPYFG